MTNTLPRPRPLDALAAETTALHAPAAGVVTALVSGGLLGLTTGNLTLAVLGVVPGVLTLASTVWGARRVARKGAAQVTPLTSPMTFGPGGGLRRLIPEPPAPSLPPLRGSIPPRPPPVLPPPARTLPPWPGWK